MILGVYLSELLFPSLQSGALITALQGYKGEMVLSHTSTQGYFSCSKMFKTQVVIHETHAELQKTRNNMNIKETPEGVLQKRRCGPLLSSGGGEWLTPGPGLLGGYKLDVHMWVSDPFNSCCQAERGFWAAGLGISLCPSVEIGAVGRA